MAGERATKEVQPARGDSSIGPCVEWHVFLQGKEGGESKGIENKKLSKIIGDR